MKRKLHNGEEIDKMVDLMTRGDPQCKIPIGSRVMKVAGDEKDHHSIGETGKVVGNIHDERVGDAYLVLFESEAFPTFIMGEKIMQL